MPPGDGRSRALFRKPGVHCLLILVLGILIYSNTFHSPFVFDDIPNISENPFVKDVSRVIGPHYLNVNDSRLVTRLTFALNHALHGLDVTGYHVLNLIIHLLNALLVYWLAILTFRSGESSPDASPSGWIPLFTALVFVSHPIQTQAVTYIVQRSSLLATLFFLLSLTAYIKARGSDSAGKLRYAFYALAIISAVLAMKSKEIAFTLPVIILLYEFIFLTGGVRTRLLYLLGLSLTILIIPFSYGMLSGAGLIDSLARIAESAAFSRWDYLNTQFRVIVTYLRLLFFPVYQNLDYDYSLSRTFFTPAVFLSFLFLLAIFCGGGYLLYRSYRADRADRLRRRVIAFGIFWFFVTLSVESSIIPIADLINEHRLYLPAVGFSLAVVSGLAYLHTGLAERGKIGANVFVLLMISVIFTLSVTAYARNRVWQDEVTLWEDVLQKSPRKLRPHFSLGDAYLKQGRFEDAIRTNQTAIQLDPNRALPHYNLGVAYQKQGRLDDAIREYQTAIRLDPKLVKPHHNLGAIYQNRGRLDDAITEYQTAIKLNPDYYASYYNLGLIYLSQGRLDEAISGFRIAISINPDHADAYNDLGVAYEEQGRPDDAFEQYRAALRIKPDHLNASNNLQRMARNRVQR